jgi:putative DNA primase/helicase
VNASYIAPGAGKVKPAAQLVAALDGDPRTGMCRCPAHQDDTPSLHISEGSNGKVLVHCFAHCEQHAVIDALVARGLWPVPGAAHGPAMSPRRSDEERRQYALRILHDTLANRGRELADKVLRNYFSRRGIVKVPPTAMFACTDNLNPYLDGCLLPDDPGMVFEVTDGAKVIGCHVTWLKWLNSSFSAKRDEEPQRQFFGPISGGYIRLYDGELEPTSKLVIAEGVESTAAAMQLASLPGIAALSANNMPKITPPPAAEYIVAADNDASGVGQRAARALAYKLVRAGHLVRVAIPSRPDTGGDAVLAIQGHPHRSRRVERHRRCGLVCERW